MVSSKTLNRAYRSKNKVRVGGRGSALKGFTPKQVAKLQEEADKKKGGGKAPAGAAPGKPKHR